MRSTFMGLETARRGMFTQQTALYTTGQNVSNASTPGYSRQRVNFQQTEPYPGKGMNMPQMPGQMGTGVKAGSIQRMRESFLDVQYRGENNKLGYWESRSESLDKMENIMNEPSDSGLTNTMNQFWQSLQDLAVDPTNAGARSVVRQRGEAVAETFNYVSNSLTAIQKDQKDQVDVSVKEVNSVVFQLNNVNQQIGSVEPHGYLPNDLYDERDRLIDQLSSMVNIKVDYVKSGGNPDPNAEGKAVIKLVSDNGAQLGVLLGDNSYNELKVNYDGVDESVKTLTLGASSIDFSQMNSTGKLKSLIESYGYEENGQATGTYTDMVSKLDNLAYTFATEFNKVHSDGISPNEITAKQKQDISFFADAGNAPISDKKGFASRIQLSGDIQNSLDNIATASGDPAIATLGDGSNVLALARVINNKYEYSANEQADFQSYYQGVIGSMAVKSQEATRLSQNSTSLQQAVEEKRQSVSSVSLDEEMTNMIQFQHAYNASARMITLQDEMLDKIINGMGAGGR
ncbi:flagellar hook-associated protein FlgK [Neobacillus sp. PS3-34]|uniref:flagellar hook-associated protein FlgK n=1 Tax=Neobacillus sp. PS3-34 TaxID=3070678 RepID=UPI0027E06653|nr:flagellar hook-associated protein FlgK [Neobacillus sp. PS3-34]WML46886.1 flagellar hook-associated protein FlgK [Neobacillus sp. PS3-34]